MMTLSSLLQQPLDLTVLVALITATATLAGVTLGAILTHILTSRREQARWEREKADEEEKNRRSGLLPGGGYGGSGGGTPIGGGGVTPLQIMQEVRETKDLNVLLKGELANQQATLRRLESKLEIVALAVARQIDEQEFEQDTAIRPGTPKDAKPTYEELARAYRTLSPEEISRELERMQTAIQKPSMVEDAEAEIPEPRRSVEGSKGGANKL